MHQNVKLPAKPRISKLSGNLVQELPEAADDEIELNYGTFRIPINLDQRTGISSIHSTITGSDLSTRTMLYISQSEIKDTKFVNSIFEANIKDARFVSCKFVKTVFEQGITLDRVEFIDCDLRNCTFYKSTLKDVSFINSQISGVGFDATTIERVSLVSSILTISDPATLRGCVLSNEQVIGLSQELARTLGIIVNS